MSLTGIVWEWLTVIMKDKSQLKPVESAAVKKL